MTETYTTEGRYDLVAAFECIHDMSDPVGVLRTMRQLVDEDGVVIIPSTTISSASTDCMPERQISKP